MPLRGLGTNGFDGEHCRLTVRRFLQLGGRHIDTAMLYNNHDDIRAAYSSSGIPRKELFLVSKIPPSEMGFTETIKAIDRIVQELGTYLDLLLIHWPANFDDKASLPACARSPSSWKGCRAATWKAMEEAYRGGKVRALGVSNFGVRHLTELIEEPTRTLPIAANQVEFHPWWPQMLLRKFCAEQYIALIAYGSLGGSLIGGAMLQAPVVTHVATAVKRTPAQVLLRWALQQNVAVIPSASSQEHLAQNFDTVEWELGSSEMDLLGVSPQDRMRIFLPDPEHAP